MRDIFLHERFKERCCRCDHGRISPRLCINGVFKNIDHCCPDCGGMGYRIVEREISLKEAIKEITVSYG